MQTIYEVREQRQSDRPEDRGWAVSKHETYAEARAKRDELAAQGRNVFISSFVVEAE